MKLYKVNNIILKALCLLFLFLWVPLSSGKEASAFGSATTQRFHELASPIVLPDVSRVVNFESKNLSLSAYGSSGSVDSFSSPSGIAFTNHGKRVFVSNASNNSVSSCSVDAIGNFSHCITNNEGDNTQLQSFYIPSGIAVTPDGKRVYVTNRDSDQNSIAYCNPSEGSIFLCKKFKLGKGFVAPVGIALAPDSKRLFVVTNGDDSTPSSVAACNLAEDGKITQCFNTGVDKTEKNPLLKYSGGLTLAQKNGKTFGYITNFGNSKITVCNVDLKSGLFSHCQNSGQNLANPSAIFVNMNMNVAYVANFGNDSVSLCKVNPDNGLLNACKNSGANNIRSPFAVTPDAKNAYVFIANGDAGNVTRCAIDHKHHEVLTECDDVVPAFVFFHSHHHFNTPQNWVTAANLNFGTNSDIGILNLGKNSMQNLSVSIPDSVLHLVQSTSCPVYPKHGSLAPDHSCFLHFSVPQNEKAKTFNFSATKTSAKEPISVLPVSISDIRIKHNGKSHSNDQLVLFRGEQNGTFSLISKRGIKNFSMTVSDKNLLKYMKGDCFNTHELKAGKACTVKYTITDMAGAGLYNIDLKSKGKTIFSFPLIIDADNALGIRNRYLGVPNYNKHDIILTNQLNRPITNIKVSDPIRKYVKIVKNDCNNKVLAPGEKCTISVFALWRPTQEELKHKKIPAGDVLNIFSDQLESVNLTLAVMPVPNTNSYASNMGGYKIKFSYWQVEDNGWTLKQVKRGYTSVFFGHTLSHVAMFNYPEGLPSNIANSVTFYVMGQTRHKTYPITKNHNFTCKGTTFHWWCK